MNKLILILAFAFGCLLPLIIGHNAVHVSAQDEGGSMHVCVDKDGALHNASLAATCPAGQRSYLIKKSDSTTDLDQPKEKEKKNEDEAAIDKAILDDLNRRLNKLENEECFSPGQSKVVAPFVVFGRDGKRVFVVDNNLASLFNSGGTEPVTSIIADPEGGYYVAKSGKNSTSFGFNANTAGFNVYEDGQSRFVLGTTSQKGTYSLKFFSRSGQTIAGIGVSSEDNAGLAVIGDQTGPKATIGLTKTGTGLIEILSGNAIAQLTEGNQHHGGRLWIANVSGVGMVEAGDAGGYGMVKAGPQGFEFIPTPGLALPGSVIIGKQ